MDEIIVAFIFSMLLGLFSLIRFDKICIFISAITLLIADYICGLERALVSVDTVVLWIVIFYMVVMEILRILKRRMKFE